MSLSQNTLVYLALLGLLAITWSASFAGLGNFALPIALGISAAKVFLIMAYFMELKKKRGLTIFMATVVTFWLAILGILVFADYLSRA